MTLEPDFDLQAAHKYFSISCFNQAWDLMDKFERTSEEDQEMLRLSLASHYHWTKRQDCAPANLSVGYWQTSRIYAMLGEPGNARKYGQLCLEIAQNAGLEPFYLGYAYEALARAESEDHHSKQMQTYLREARKAAEKITDPAAKKQLLDDLSSIR
jgi:superoxide dismutase